MSFFEHANSTIVHAMNCTPQYIIAKGWITSSDMASKGLNLRQAVVKGQILPGIPVSRIELRFVSR